MSNARPPQVPEGAAWTVHHDEVTCAYSVWNGEEVIADLFYASGFPEDQEAQRLKAHTIAVAPALVAALERIAEQFCESDDCFASADARAALTLARGGA